MHAKLPDSDTMIAKIVETRGNLAAVARAYGASRQGVYDYARRHPSVQRALTEEREKMLDNTESALYARILAGDITAMIFFLKTQGKSRGYVERVEGQHTGEIVHRVVYGDDGTHNPTA